MRKHLQIVIRPSQLRRIPHCALFTQRIFCARELFEGIGFELFRTRCSQAGAELHSNINICVYAHRAHRIAPPTRNMQADIFIAAFLSIKLMMPERYQPRSVKRIEFRIEIVPRIFESVTLDAAIVCVCVMLGEQFNYIRFKACLFNLSSEELECNFMIVVCSITLSKQGERGYCDFIIHYD